MRKVGCCLEGWMNMLYGIGVYSGLVVLGFMGLDRIVMRCLNGGV